MTGLVGREAELARLDGALRQARLGAGSIVLLSGEAGVGKTRLVADLAARSDATLLRGAATHGAAAPYGPVVAALRSHLRSDPDGLGPSTSSSSWPARRRCQPALPHGAQARRAAVDVDSGGLSRREQEVVRLLAVGRTNREIAHDLFLSTRTVDMHMRNILRKLDCRSRVEAAGRARELGG